LASLGASEHKPEKEAENKEGEKKGQDSTHPEKGAAFSFDF